MTDDEKREKRKQYDATYRRKHRKPNGHAVARERMDRDRVAIGKDSRGRVVTQEGPGKPKAKIDAEQLEKLLQMGCTEEECADFLNVSVETLQTESWAPHIRRGNNLCKVSLRRKQMERAMQGSDTMLIWQGKNKLGQSDNGSVDSQMTATATLYNPPVWFVVSDGDGRPKGYTSAEAMFAAHNKMLEGYTSVEEMLTAQKLLDE